jgi:hypothetical protein
MQCVIDILTSGRIDGKDGDMTKVSSAGFKLDFIVCRRKAGKNLMSTHIKRRKEEMSLE